MLLMKQFLYFIEVNMQIIPPRSGKGIELKKGQRLKVIDVQGEQVSDFFCFMKDDHGDYLSSGRTMDYLSKLVPSTGDILYSSKSKPMARIVEDSVGRHDFLLTPCSKDTFRIIYGDEHPHHGCEGNLKEAFRSFNMNLEAFPTTLNLFMNVVIDKEGSIKVDAPKSKRGDFIIIEAMEDLLIGLTACSALQSNNGSFKPIGFEVLP